MIASKELQLGILKYLRNVYKESPIKNIRGSELIEHFDIDLNSDNVAEDFIQNNYELFKRSYDMFKEIKDYPVRYGIS